MLSVSDEYLGISCNNIVTTNRLLNPVMKKPLYAPDMLYVTLKDLRPMADRDIAKRAKWRRLSFVS